MKRESSNATGLFLIVSALFLSGDGLCEAPDWASWKGPNQTGVSNETGWNPEALSRPLQVNWQINVGAGYSSVSIKDEFLYTMGYDKKTRENIIYCFRVKNAEPVWRYAYPSDKGQYEGPKATPVVDEGRLYTFGQEGMLLCLDAETGSLLWQKQVSRELGATPPHWRFSSSVLIEDDKALVNAGEHGMAFDKKTGDVIWSSAPGKGNYSTPVTFEWKGKRIVAIYGTDHLYGMTLEKGKVLWSYPWQAKYDIIAADPVLFDDKVFISTGYGRGCVLVDLSDERPRKIWRNKNLNTHFSTAIHLDGYIYGVHGNAGQGELRCIDAADGSIQWSENLDFGSIIASNGYLIMLNERGSLFVIRADPSAYREVSRKENIIDKLCWTAPVLCRSTLYIRNNKGDIASISLG